MSEANTSTNKKKNWFLRHYIITTILVIAIIIGVNGQSEETPSSPVEKEWVGISCVEFHEIFGLNSNLSDLQKDEKFKEYKNKWVKWEGEVSSVDETFGKLQLQVKCLKSTFVSDAIATFPDSAKEKLLGFQKGDSVNFSGQLASWSAVLATSVRNAQIIE